MKWKERTRDEIIATAREIGWADPESAPREPEQSMSFEGGTLAHGHVVALLCFDPSDHAVIVRTACWSIFGAKAEWWNLEAEEPLDLDVIGWMRMPATDERIAS